MQAGRQAATGRPQAVLDDLRHGTGGHGAAVVAVRQAREQRLGRSVASSGEQVLPDGGKTPLAQNHERVLLPAPFALYRQNRHLLAAPVLAELDVRGEGSGFLPSFPASSCDLCRWSFSGAAR